MVNKTVAKAGLGVVVATSVVTPSVMAVSKSSEINKFTKENEQLENKNKPEESPQITPTVSKKELEKTIKTLEIEKAKQDEKMNSLETESIKNTTLKDKQKKYLAEKIRKQKLEHLLKKAKEMCKKPENKSNPSCKTIEDAPEGFDDQN